MAGEEGVAQARGAVTPSVTAAVSPRGLAAPGFVEAGARLLPQEDAGSFHLGPRPSLLPACAQELDWRAEEGERSW